MADDGDHPITYQFQADRELWRRWADTIPRSETLSARIETLIAQDLEAARRGGYDDMEERTARLLASRIKHRGTTALSALENDNTDKVAEEIEHMVEIAGQFDE